MPEIIIIVAVAKNGVIGKDNQLLWNIPEDMAHFKALTQGHAVLMGRKTWESLPERFRPLPGRRNIVITRQTDYAAPGAVRAASMEAGIAAAHDAEKLFIIGGAEIYAQAMALADTLEITEVDLEPTGDAWFPRISASGWQESNRIEFKSANTNGAFVKYSAVRDEETGAGAK